ncbi:MAG: hypothetical protein HY319_15445 [Armatimonadetes bacterium]|nr:hypothetical protein [Armatimonadota bacterium]
MNLSARERSYASPLGMVTQEPNLTMLVGYLQSMRARILSEPGAHVLRFSRSHLDEVRSAFARTIRQGEGRLHRLCALACRSFLRTSPYELSSVVIGEVEHSGERFTLVQKLELDELFAHTDLDLGNRQLQRLRFADQGSFRRALLVANFVEYQPEDSNSLGVHKLISRIKAEEEIWNKVVDEIFDLDALVQRDKQLRHMSRYIKDIFGVKIVVAEREAVRACQRHLAGWRWSQEELAELNVPYEPGTYQLEFLEVKDYLSNKSSKGSGWRALKSVVRWWDTTFEIQVQSLRNYFQERERLTRESHAGFKARREQLRNQVAQVLPLFGFYRSLLRWLFLSPGEPAPSYPSVSIELTD